MVTCGPVTSLRHHPLREPGPNTPLYVLGSWPGPPRGPLRQGPASPRRDLTPRHHINPHSSHRTAATVQPEAQASGSSPPLKKNAKATQNLSTAQLFPEKPRVQTAMAVAVPDSQQCGHWAGVAKATLEDPNPAHTPATAAASASRMIKSRLHAVIHPHICPAGAEPSGSDQERAINPGQTRDRSSAGSCQACPYTGTSLMLINAFFLKYIAARGAWLLAQPPDPLPAGGTGDVTGIGTP